MPSFEELMALSATQTKEAESKLQQTLELRKQKTMQQRKEQEERERKDRERENERRKAHFARQKQEAEDAERREKARQAKEEAAQRRLDEQKNTLLYGPKKAKATGVSSSSGSSSPKWPTRKPQVQDEDDGVFVGSTLTREEKRQLKLDRELNRSYGSAKRASRAGGYSKAGRRLPGGAVDIVTSSGSPAPDYAYMSVKERIAAEPMGLQRLNVNKRDTRTIDEYHRDMKAKKAQVIQGDEARTFNDWFSTKKKADTTSVRPSPAESTSPSPPRTSSPALAPSSSTSASAPVKSKLSASSTPASRKPQPSTTNNSSKPSTKSTSTKSATKPTPSSPPTTASGFPAVIKKRKRTPSRSPSPPPAKQRRRDRDRDLDRESERGKAYDDDDGADFKPDDIWKIMGLNRGKYLSRPAYSDDESDMEADASAMEREEKRSARVARKEDEEAAREQRRHEEEKRRRKMMKA